MQRNYGGVSMHHPIMRPERYGAPEDAAKARGCSTRNCYKWMRILRDSIRDEASTVDALVLLQLSALTTPTTSAPTAVTGQLAAVQLDLREALPRAPAPPSTPPSPAANTPSSQRGLDRGTSDRTPSRHWIARRRQLATKTKAVETSTRSARRIPSPFGA